MWFFKNKKFDQTSTKLRSNCDSKSSRNFLETAMVHMYAMIQQYFFSGAHFRDFMTNPFPRSKTVKNCAHSVNKRLILLPKLTLLCHRLGLALLGLLTGVINELEAPVPAS